jgi:hypothetical protein
MNAIKTTAIVENSKTLKLSKELKDIKNGSEIELLILMKKKLKPIGKKYLPK